jgi:leader peptidase (prepilin peptidase)/N-methyltransferase
MPATLLPVLAGPFIGSFAGVLIERLPQDHPVVFARSACPACGHKLGPADLVPILSYALRRGRCAHCHAPIGRFHLDVELAATAVALWACLAASDAQAAWIASGLGWTLLTLAWIDGRTLLLPDSLTLPLLLAGLAITAWLTPEDLPDHAVAAVAGYAAVALLALAYRRWRGQDGIGMGDAKLLAAGGAWLGTEALPWVLVLAATAGMIAGLLAAYRLRRIDAATRLPFGPWLALAIWLFHLHLQPLL